MQGRFQRAQQTLWAVDALLLVLVFTVMILILPVPRTRVPVTGR